MRTKKKKGPNPYMAWWALPFFLRETNGVRPVRILMLGYHKPSDMGIPPKPDVTLIREPDIIETIPFPGKDLPKIASSVIVCSANENIMKNATLVADMTSKIPNPYREFDIHKMEVIDGIRLAEKYGENYDVPRQTQYEDIRLLREGFSYFVRKGRTTNVHALIAIGKDIRYDVPVILFRKTWNNFTDVMWLWDSGIKFLAGLKFLVNYPPLGTKYAFLSDQELDFGLKKWTNRLKSNEFINVDIKKNIPTIVEKIR